MSNQKTKIEKTENTTLEHNKLLEISQALLANIPEWEEMDKKGSVLTGYNRTPCCVKAAIKRLTGPEGFAVYDTLLTHVNKTPNSGTIGDCFPSIALVAKESGISPSTVTRVLKKLEGYGFIIISHHGNNRQSNYYYFPYELDYEGRAKRIGDGVLYYNLKGDNNPDNNNNNNNNNDNNGQTNKTGKKPLVKSKKKTVKTNKTNKATNPDLDETLDIIKPIDSTQDSPIDNKARISSVVADIEETRAINAAERELQYAAKRDSQLSSQPQPHSQPQSEPFDIKAQLASLNRNMTKGYQDVDDRQAQIEESQFNQRVNHVIDPDNLVF